MKKILVGIVWIGIMASFAQAGIVVNAGQDNSITPGSVWDSAADNFEIRGKAGATYSRKAYVRFDLSGVSYDPEESATFAVTCLASPTYAGKIFISGLDDGFAPGTGVLDTDWVETTIDWTNAPGNNVTSPYGLDSAATTTITSQQMTAGSVTNGLRLEYTIIRLGDFVQTDGSVTLMMSSYDAGSGQICKFSSSENSTLDGPALTIDGTNAVVILPEGTLEANQDNSIHTAGLWDSTSEEIEIRGKAGTNFSRKAYAHFDLSGLSYDPEDSATFQLTCLASPTYAGKIFVYGLDDGFVSDAGELSSDWQETEVLWGNAPGNDVTHPYFFDNSEATIIADQQMTLGSVTNGLLLEYTINRLADFVQADGSVTIMMGSYDAGSGQILKIASSENVTYTGPTLVVDGTNIPAFFNPEILGIVSVSDSVMELTVSCSNPTELYPKTALALSTSTVWGSVGHSTNGIAPFVVTNLGYSAISGENFLIYIEAGANQKFFKIVSE